MYLLTEWAGRTGKYVARGQDNNRCASWLRAKYFPVQPYLQSMTLNLGHIALIPVFVSSNVVLLGFRWTCPSSRPVLRGKGKRGREQHVNVIPSIDPSSNVTDCSSSPGLSLLPLSEGRALVRKLLLENLLHETQLRLGETIGGCVSFWFGQRGQRFSHVNAR